MKTLVIINGVTGAIGSACLARFSREHDTTIIGLSRQAPDIDTFTKNGVLPDATLACSIGDIASQKDCEKFSRALNVSHYNKIIYIHALGTFPTEIDSTGSVSVSHDNDGDGIDDRVLHISHNAFFAMTDALQERGLPVHALTFGSISDKFKTSVHASWWSVMEKTKLRMQENPQKSEGISYIVLNISSVASPSELLHRPFVFIETDADMKFWLLPSEIADRVVFLTLSSKKGFTEDEIFHSAPYYKDNHFDKEEYTARRKKELGVAQKA